MKELSLRSTGFVPLAETKTRRFTYGGNQAWFVKKSHRIRGCGPVAAANLLCYLAGSEEKYRPLYPGEALTQTDFLALMDTMYAELSPAWIGGLFSCKRFARGVTHWAKSRGVLLTAHLSGPRTHSQADCLASIRQGLEQDRPVAALNLKWRHIIPSGENFGWHWVTITGLRESSDSNPKLVVSSWGSRFLLDWDVYWNACRRALLPGGFVWFQ